MPEGALGMAAGHLADWTACILLGFVLGFGCMDVICARVYDASMGDLDSRWGVWQGDGLVGWVLFWNQVHCRVFLGMFGGFLRGWDWFLGCVMPQWPMGFGLPARTIVTDTRVDACWVPGWAAVSLPLWRDFLCVG